MLVLSRAHCLGAVVAGLSSCRLRRDSSVSDADDSIGPDQKVLSSAVVSYRHLLLLVPLDVDQLLLVSVDRLLGLGLEARVGALLLLLDQDAGVRRVCNVCWRSRHYMSSKLITICHLCTQIYWTTCDAFICAKVAQKMNLILRKLLMLGSLLSSIRRDHFRGDLLGSALGPCSHVCVGALQVIVSSCADEISNLR